MNKYGREQDTHHARAALLKLIAEGEGLKNWKFESLDDLKLRQRNIDDWIDRVHQLLVNTSIDPLLAGRYCQPTGKFNFENHSGSSIANSLKAKVDNRNRGFRQLFRELDSDAPVLP